MLISYCRYRTVQYPPLSGKPDHSFSGRWLYLFVSCVTWTLRYHYHPWQCLSLCGETPSKSFWLSGIIILDCKEPLVGTPLLDLILYSHDLYLIILSLLLPSSPHCISLVSGFVSYCTFPTINPKLTVYRSPNKSNSNDMLKSNLLLYC